MTEDFSLLPAAEQALATGIVGDHPAQQRRAMAKAITLLESTRPDHRLRADALLNALLPHTGRAFRLGISGVPGVGKSTFIEALGLYLIGQGHRVAVLAVDPSSSVSGGSILGDKTRMEHLSVHPNAYIRPSPSSGTLGGVAEKTREAMLIAEAAGYDVVIIETVGVGQSETAVSGMMELADLVVINKADIDPNAATRARAQITSALRLLGMHQHHGGGHGDAHGHGGDLLWQPQVLQLSALKGAGLPEFWAAVTRFRELQAASGRLDQRRQQQSLAWMWERIEAGLRARFRAHPEVRGQLADTTEQVRAGRLAASVAARRLLDLLN